MKSTLFTLLAVLSFSALAQTFDRSINDKLKQLQVAAEVGDIDRLNIYDQANLDSSLSQALSILGRGPRQRPRSPVDTGRHQQGGIRVVGLIESNAFHFEGRGPGELSIACRQAVASVNLQADDILFTVNGAPFKIMRNDHSYWNKDEFCPLILETVSQSNPREFGPVLSVVGTIENESISLRGDRGEVLLQCLQSTRAIEKADDIMLSFNNRPLRSARNATAWWNGPARICWKVATMIDEEGI